ncbi:hypothetical protein D9M68_753530 [compost metagenome]
MAVFFDFQRFGPALLHRVAQAVQRTDAGVAAPGEHQLLRTASSDQQVIYQVGRHAHQGQLTLALTNQLVGRGSWNKVGKTFEGDGVAVIDEALYGVAKGNDFGHRCCSRSFDDATG